jgi:hypothetical protein
MSRAVRFLTMVMTGLAVVALAPAPTFATAPAAAASAEDAEQTAAESSAPAGGAAAGDSATAVREAGAPKPGPDDVAYGVGIRGRWVSVPGWLLGIFTKHNVPLSTVGHFGIEGFRRRGNFDVALAFSYQNMSPSDGNWLGVGKDATIDTDYVQFKGLAIYTADISFIWHSMFNDWFGAHFGAGLGVGYVAGHLYRTDSTTPNCTDQTVGDLSQCHPVGVTCANGTCTPATALNRNADSNVPPVVPIVNVVAGLTFRVPTVKGWEGKVEAGFYDAFFAGLGVGYTF